MELTLNQILNSRGGAMLLSKSVGNACAVINPLSANPTKWSNTLKQFECV